MMLAAAVVVFALRHLPAERLISTGMSGLALGIVLTLVGIAVSSAPVMILGTVIVGGGFGSAFAGMLRRLLPLAGPSERAGLLAAFFVASYLAFALPAIVAGLVAPVLGLVTTTYLYQGVLLGLVAASFVAMRPAKVHHLLEV
jgi:MFS family permease